MNQHALEGELGRLDLSALEDSIKPEPEETEYETDFDQEQLITDLNEALILVSRAKTLIDYLSDPELCKTVSKKERGSMMKLSSKIGEYIDSIESTYGDIGSVVYDLSL